MAAADMVSPPSLPPISPPLYDPKAVLSLIYVEVLIIVAVVAMFLLHVLGSLRRQSGNGLVHHLVIGVYALSYPLVGYTIGRMESTNLYFNDFTVWAVFLLLLLSSTDSLTACRLSDINNWKSMCVKQLFNGLLLVYILAFFGYDMDHNKKENKEDHGDNKGYVWLWIPLSAILFIAILKSYVMIASMRMVSKSYLGKNANVIAQYMEHKDNKLELPFDPVTLGGYRYMVAGEKYCIKRPGSTPWYEKDGLNVITVEQIWQRNENLLTADRGKVLKDMCLSMALSKMLNRRFAGIKLTEVGLPKTHDFVFEGLLVDGDKPHLRAFRVIEQELVFVHDIYYTRYYYLYQKGRYLPLCLPVIMFALCWWLAVASMRVNKHDHSIIGSKEYHGMKNHTIFITVALAFLEAYQLYLYIASGWFKVGLIQSYITTPILQWCCCFEKITDLLLRLKAFCPWKRRHGQYCLLDKLGHKSMFNSCLHYATLCLVDKAMEGRKKSVKLSENVKKAIVDSLLGSNNGHLTNGVTSLQNKDVQGELISWACEATATEGGVTRTILLWHIATTLCEHQLKGDARAKEEDTVLVVRIRTASTLSQYCMHLLAFAPDLLPDHSSISESVLDQTIDEAGQLLEGAKTLESRCEKLMAMKSTDGANGKLVLQGVRLARHLLENIQEPRKRWKVLSDFWAELMLYVSPSDDARAHLELLARGGEFITHLWALLTHAGILERGHTGPANV